MSEKHLLDKDSAQAVLAAHLARVEKRDIIFLRLLRSGIKLDENNRKKERPFFYFEAGENDGWYVHRDDNSVMQDPNCVKAAP